MADLGTLTSAVTNKVKRMILVPKNGFISRKLDSTLKRSTSQYWSILKPTNTTTGEKITIGMVTGTLSGTVTTSGVADVNYLVHLFYRPTGYLLESKRTSSTGTFSFSFHLNKNEVQNYTIIALDLTKTHNAIVYDLLTPG